MKNRIKKIVGLILVVFVIGGLTACSSKTSDASAKPKEVFPEDNLEVLEVSEAEIKEMRIEASGKFGPVYLLKRDGKYYSLSQLPTKRYDKVRGFKKYADDSGYPTFDVVTQEHRESDGQKASPLGEFYSLFHGSVMFGDVPVPTLREGDSFVVVDGEDMAEGLSAYKCDAVEYVPRIYGYPYYGGGFDDFYLRDIDSEKYGRYNYAKIGNFTTVGINSIKFDKTYGTLNFDRKLNFGDNFVFSWHDASGVREFNLCADSKRYEKIADEKEYKIKESKEENCKKIEIDTFRYVSLTEYEFPKKLPSGTYFMGYGSDCKHGFVFNVN